MQEGESLLQTLGSRCRLPLEVYAAIFFLGGIAFFAESFASLMVGGFGFFFVGGGTNAASAWARKSMSLSRGMSVCPVKTSRRPNSVSFSSGNVARVQDRTSSSVFSLFSLSPT